MTTEMEIDVMKGLVLAQHQRIERQRSRVQELERDLRWVSGALGGSFRSTYQCQRRKNPSYPTAACGKVVCPYQ